MLLVGRLAPCDDTLLVELAYDAIGMTLAEVVGLLFTLVTW